MDKLYAGLSSELKAPALKMLSDELEDRDKALIVEAFMADPEDWWMPYHFYWGMSIRNLLRTKGYGEEYFAVDNLDDIYVALVKEALGLPI